MTRSGSNSKGTIDEYDAAEVSTILPRAWRATSQDEVRQIVREEFERSFGSAITIRTELYEPMAAEVFEAVLSHRSV
jgi:hypothetical protein